MPIANEGVSLALRRILKQPVEEQLQGTPAPQQLEKRPVPLSTIKLPVKLRQSEPLPVPPFKTTVTAGVSPSPAVQLPAQLRQGYVQPPVQPKTPPPEQPPVTPPEQPPQKKPTVSLKQYIQDYFATKNLGAPVTPNADVLLIGMNALRNNPKDAEAQRIVGNATNYSNAVQSYVAEYGRTAFDRAVAAETLPVAATMLGLTLGTVGGGIPGGVAAIIAATAGTPVVTKTIAPEKPPITPSDITRTIGTIMSFGAPVAGTAVRGALGAITRLGMGVLGAGSYTVGTVLDWGKMTPQERIISAIQDATYWAMLGYSAYKVNQLYRYQGETTNPQKYWASIGKTILQDEKELYDKGVLSAKPLKQNAISDALKEFELYPGGAVKPIGHTNYLLDAFNRLKSGQISNIIQDLGGLISQEHTISLEQAVSDLQNTMGSAGIPSSVSNILLESGLTQSQIAKMPISGIWESLLATAQRFSISVKDALATETGAVGKPAVPAKPTPVTPEVTRESLTNPVLAREYLGIARNNKGYRDLVVEAKTESENPRLRNRPATKRLAEIDAQDVMQARKKYDAEQLAIPTTKPAAPAAPGVTVPKPEILIGKPSSYLGRQRISVEFSPYTEKGYEPVIGVPKFELSKGKGEQWSVYYEYLDPTGLTKEVFVSRTDSLSNAKTISIDQLNKFWELKGLGYDIGEISTMPVEQARNILGNKIPKQTVPTAEVGMLPTPEVTPPTTEVAQPLTPPIPNIPAPLGKIPPPAPKIPPINPTVTGENVIGLRPIQPGLVRGEVIGNVFKRTLGRIGIQMVESEPSANAAMRERTRVHTTIESNANVIGTEAENTLKVFAFDKKGGIPALTGIDSSVPGAPTIQDVAARLPKYRDSLSPAQLEALAKIKSAIEPYNQLLGELGVEVPQREDIIDGGFYLPRGRAALEGVDEPLRIGGARRGVKKGFERPAIFASQAEGISKGYEYTSIGNALTSYAFDAGMRAIDAHIANYFKALTDDEGQLLGETVKMRLMRQHPNLAKQVEDLNANLNRLKRNIGALTQRQLDVIDFWQNNPDFTNIDDLLDVVEMRGGKPPQTMTGLKSLFADTKAKLEALRPEYKKALRQVQSTPRDQGVINLPALQGRTFPREVANAANIILSQEGKTVGRLSPIVNTIQAFNNLYIGVRATLDNSALGIQGLLGLYGRPRAYAEALGINIRAWGLRGDKILGKFLNDFDNQAKKSGRLTVSDWSRSGLHLGGATGEFALGKPEGKLANLPGVRQANRAFGYFGDALRLTWADNELSVQLSKRSLNEIKSSGDLDRIANSANVMTGWTVERAGGSVGDLVLLAPKFLQSRLETIAKAAGSIRPNATLDQRMARKSLLSMIGFGVVVTVLANSVIREADTDFRLIVNGKRNPKFMRIKFKGRYYSMFGTWDSLLGVMVNIATGRPLVALRNLASGTVSIAWDLITGKDYNYQAIMDTPAHFVEWLANCIVPFSIGQLPEGIKEFAGGVVKGDISQAVGGGVNIISQLLGVKSFPEDLRMKWEDSLKTYYSIDENAKDNRRKDYPIEDAKLFILGETNTFLTPKAKDEAEKLIALELVDTSSIKNYQKEFEPELYQPEVKPVESTDRETLYYDYLGEVPNYAEDYVKASGQSLTADVLAQRITALRQTKSGDDKLLRRYTKAVTGQESAFRTAYLRDHPDIDAALNLWGNLSSVKSPEAADILRSRASQLGIPETVIPALKPKATTARVTTATRTRTGVGGVMAIGEKVLAARR